MQRAQTLAQQTTAPAPVPAGRRAVVVSGVRTPFTRAFGEQLSMDCIDLGVAAVKGLVDRTKVDPKQIDQVVWGGVILRSGCPNTAREIVIDAGLPLNISGHTETMACASGLKAVLSAVQIIESGNADVVIAGGSDSTSCSEMPMDRNVTQSLALYTAGKIPFSKFYSVAGLPTGWMPQRPAVAERSTGKTMGYHADVMASLCGVTRQEQDEFAMRSHKSAAAATQNGLLAEELLPVTTKKSPLAPVVTIKKDTMVRAKQNPAKLQSLGTVFRKPEQGGTITAATASPLTDGAAACLVMSADKAKALGYEAFTAVRSWAATAINPQPNLLLAPALGIPLALQRAGLKLADIDYFEIHEAFAGQVLATIKCLASAELCKEYLNREQAVGQIPLDKVNIYGGSVSIGHPFGATGARITTNVVRIFKTKPEAKYVLTSVCAAGGLGLVTIFERI